MDGDERNRGEKWLATVGRACDQIELAVEAHPDAAATIHEQVRCRLAEIFGPRQWTAENIEENVMQILDDCLFKDVPAELRLAVQRFILIDVQMRVVLGH